jgi:hypothetical protein
VLTSFFRCPSRLSELTDSSPRVCKPYLVVRSHVEPYILPYYHTYASPYVDVVKPYAQTFNEQVYVPASKIAKQGYDAYGGPPFEQARKYTKKQWQNEIIPRLYTAWNNTNNIYGSKVEPYVQRFISTVAPLSADVSSKVIHVNDKYVMPIYLQSKPLISKTYCSGHGILVDTLMPLAQRTWYSAIIFANSAVWPRATGLYSENIEPQLVKIGEKLTSYREGRKLRSVIDEVDG